MNSNDVGTRHPRYRATATAGAAPTSSGGREELFRFFTLAPADVTFVDRAVVAARRIGWAWR